MSLPIQHPVIQPLFYAQVASELRRGAHSMSSKNRERELLAEEAIFTIRNLPASHSRGSYCSLPIAFQDRFHSTGWYDVIEWVPSVQWVHA